LYSNEQGEDRPVRLSKWDYFALLANTASDIFEVIANFFYLLTCMLDNRAIHEDEKKSFHEYAARTIETLREGE